MNRVSFFLAFCLLSLKGLGQPIADIEIRKYHIQKMIITLNSPYQKTVEEYTYSRKGKQLIYRTTDFDIYKQHPPGTWEWKSFYQDTFLIKQVVKVYHSKVKVVNSGVILYGYEKETPFRRLWRSEKIASGEIVEEHYFYNKQRRLDSISIFSNDSSYSNGIRYSGNNLFYKTVKPQKTAKYVYYPDGELRQSIECNNYYRPLHSLDSAGCIRNNYTKQGDTLVQEVKQWNYVGRALTYGHKQVVKDGWAVYEERYGEEKSITVVKKNKRGLVTEVQTITYPVGRKQWKTKIKYNYFFWN
jgi:hypothetical protein